MRAPADSPPTPIDVVAFMNFPTLFPDRARQEVVSVPLGAAPRPRDTLRAIMAKSPCPLSRTQFLEKAEPIKVVINGQEIIADKREFSTGSFGWYHNGKINVVVDGKSLSIQLGLNLTVVGSKEAER